MSSFVETDVVVVAAKRTPMGSFMGALAGLSASDLGAAAIAAAVAESGLSGSNTNRIDEVLMGNCLMAGQGQAPARQALRKSGLPDSVGAVTLSKMCGSGMKSVMLGHDMLKAGSADVVVAGGMESMSNAPYLLPKARSGMRFGHGQVLDHMLLDGLEDAYETGRPMGSFGEQAVAHYGFTREQQDAFATASVVRAQTAMAQGLFVNEIVPVQVNTRSGAQTLTSDEAPSKIKLEKIPQLKPAFDPQGTITAASSSSITDGAAALVLMRAEQANTLQAPIMARVRGHSTFAHAPQWFTTAPVGAVKKLLQKIQWKVQDVDLWEVNEAFAVVPMLLMHELGVAHEQVNVHGGACALGHPIGASGARVLTTLLYALQARGLKRGIATLCVGGGEATAMALELA